MSLTPIRGSENWYRQTRTCLESWHSRQQCCSPQYSRHSWWPRSSRSRHHCRAPGQCPANPCEPISTLDVVPLPKIGGKCSVIDWDRAHLPIFAQSTQTRHAFRVCVAGRVNRYDQTVRQNDLPSLSCVNKKKNVYEFDPSWSFFRQTTT